MIDDDDNLDDFDDLGTDCVFSCGNSAFFVKNRN